MKTDAPAIEDYRPDFARRGPPPERRAKTFAEYVISGIAIHVSRQLLTARRERRHQLERADAVFVS